MDPGRGHPLSRPGSASLNGTIATVSSFPSRIRKDRADRSLFCMMPYATRSRALATASVMAASRSAKSCPSGSSRTLLPFCSGCFGRAVVKGPYKDDQSWHGAVGDENRDESLVRAIAGREQDEKAPAARHGLFRGPGPDQQAHEQPEIVPGDMDQIALVDILPAPQPRPAHATPVQDVREGALDQFRPLAHRLLADF